MEADMARKYYKTITSCIITKNTTHILKPYVDSDKNKLFREYGLSSGVTLEVEGYVYCAIYGSVIDICPDDKDAKNFILTIQYDKDQIIRYKGLYEVFVRVNDQLYPWQSVGSAHNCVTIEYATTWKKNARWSIKLFRNTWFKQDPMPFVDGSIKNMPTESSINYYVPESAKDEYSEEKVRLITEVSISVMKYGRSYGFTLFSPIISQALVDSNWGKENMTKNNNCYFIRLKDNKYSSCDECIRNYYIYLGQEKFSRMKEMIDTSAFIDSFVDCGYYPKGSKYPQLIKDTLQKWNLTQFDGITSNMTQQKGYSDEEFRSRYAFMKDFSNEQFTELYGNE